MPSAMTQRVHKFFEGFVASIFGARIATGEDCRLAWAAQSARPFSYLLFSDSSLWGPSDYDDSKQREESDKN